MSQRHNHYQFEIEGLEGRRLLSGSPAISIGDVSLAEGSGGGETAFVFTVSLSQASRRPVRVDFATADGTATAAGGDYKWTTGRVKFDPGQTSKTVTVQVRGDALREADETFAVKLSRPENAVIADGHGAGTILDDDNPAPSVSVGDVAVTEGNAGVHDAVLTVSLSAAATEAVSVNFRTEDGAATSAGGDYQAISGTLTFGPGERTRTVAVPVFGDRLVEPDEAFAVRLSGAVGARIADDLGVVTLRDDEPRVSISDVSAYEGCGCSGTTTPFTFTVSLSRAYDEPVTVGYQTADHTATVAGGDYRAESGTLTFARGETSKTVSVEVLGDMAVESDELFLVNLTGSSLAGSLADAQGTGWILDDDWTNELPEQPWTDPGCNPDNPQYPNC